MLLHLKGDDVECSSCLYTHGTNKVLEWYVLGTAKIATQYWKLQHVVIGTYIVVLEAAGTIVG